MPARILRGSSRGAYRAPDAADAEFQNDAPVRHSASDMFDLVADVERYPEFVPFCESLVVLSRTATGDQEVLIATESTVSYSLFRETFTSNVTLDRPKLDIPSEYLDGPFRHLENVGGSNRSDGAPVSGIFAIHYEFRTRTLSALMGTIFDCVFHNFADAFETRADQIYRVERSGRAIRRVGKAKRAHRSSQGIGGHGASRLCPPFCNGPRLVNPFLLHPSAGFTLLSGVGAGPPSDGVK